MNNGKPGCTNEICKYKQKLNQSRLGNFEKSRCRLLGAFMPVRSQDPRNMSDELYEAVSEDDDSPAYLAKSYVHTNEGQSRYFITKKWLR